MAYETPPGVHLPQPSFWPIVLSLSLTLVAVGVLTTWILSLLGVVGLVGSVVGWALENRSEERGTGSHV